MKSKVFITGITGCVGHYLFDLLASNPDYQLYLLARQPQKMMRSLSGSTVIQDGMSNIGKYADLLKDMDHVVHVAAGWGETEANYDHTIELFNLLDPHKCQKVIYFSTASILDNSNQLVEKVGQIGTSYIKGKYLCYKKLPQLKIYDRLITLFPTWVLGGDKSHPYSHAMLGIEGAVKWLRLLRFLTVDLSFHFIHARDIAQIAAYLLRTEIKGKEFVLGQPLITADRLIGEMCDHYHLRRYFRVKLDPLWVKTLAPLFGKKLSDWDLYSLAKKNFSYNVVGPESFGLKSEFKTIKDVLK
ncbi:MAG: NAD(P)-dependent oxidoreductase [Candidatus Margulisbacteria bacterium]|nr:NAD(P)-dependent oxidoreductase [Candidatus Margulisiibacteriota bacterium]